jgi:transposase
MPTVSTAVMSICLEHFANEVGTNATRRIVLVLDGAGWHTAKDLVVPEGIDLVFQPPYSPELQPSEQLWPLLHEPLANRNFVDLDELEDVLCEACCGLEDDPEYLRSQTLFHWWSDAIR